MWEQSWGTQPSTAVGCGRRGGGLAPGGDLGRPRCPACLREPAVPPGECGETVRVGIGSRRADRSAGTWEAQQLSWVEGWPGPRKPSTVPPGATGRPRGGARPLVGRTGGPTQRPRGHPGQGSMPHWHGGPQGEGTACEAGASGEDHQPQVCALNRPHSPSRPPLPGGGGLRCGQARRRVGPPGTEPKAQSQDRGGFWEKGHLEWVLRSWAPTVAAGLGGQATGEAWGPQRG